jgi:hypothetical protein
MALLLAAAPAAAQVATPGRPAVLSPLVETRARCSANPQLVVAVTGFTPPRQGAADLIVSWRGADGRVRRLGQVSIYPQRAFSAPLAQAQRFGFAIPRRAMGPRASVIVALADGNGGASLVVGEARITPAPQERCRQVSR